MPTTPKTSCPFCGSARFSRFHRFTRLLETEAFRKYQEAEVPLSADGGGEPLMLCGDCHGLFRRDVIDYAQVFANYHGRQQDKDPAVIRRAIDAEFAVLAQDPDCKYRDEVAFLTRFVAAQTDGRPTRSLDIGSREGVLPRALQERGFAVTMIEPTKAYCDVLAADHGLSVVCGLFPSDALPDGGFDVISALEVLHRVDDLTGFIRAANAKLRPGGHLMLGLSNIWRLGLNYLTQQHRAVFSPASAATLLARNGFELLCAEAVENRPTGGLRVMARKTGAPAPAAPVADRDAPVRLKTQLLRAEFGLVGPRAWARSEALDGVLLRGLMALRALGIRLV